MNRAQRVAWPALTFVAAVVAAGTALSLTGGGGEALVAARVIVRLVLVLAAGAVLGVLAALQLVLRADGPRRGRLLDAAAAAAGLWAVAAGVTVFLLYLDAAPSLSSPSFGPGLVTYLSDPGLGLTWVAAAGAAAVLTAALVAVRSRIGIALLGPATVLALLPVALQATGSADALGTERTIFSGELALLVGGGTSVGLLALVAMVRVAPSQLRRAAWIAGVCGGIATVAALLDSAAQIDGGVVTGAVAARIVALVTATAVAVAAVLRPSRALLRTQLILLGGASGFTAVVSAARRLDVHHAARTTPAEILTGAPLPPPISASSLLTAVQLDPLWLIVCVLLLVGYGAGRTLLRRRAQAWPLGRTIAWVAGVVLLAWLTSGGPAAYRDVLLSAHLLQHAALLLAVPLLLALGAPARLWAAALRRNVRSRRTGLLARPVTAAALAVVTVAALYGSDLLMWSLTDPVGAEVSTLMCLAAGCLVTAALIGSTVRSRTATATAIGLLVVEAGGSAVLASSSGLLLARWFGAMGWGTDALIDQRTGVLITGAVLVLPTLMLLMITQRRARGEDVLPRDRPIVPVEEEVPA